MAADNKNNVVGSGRPLKDAALKVTGQLKYVDDMKVSGMVYGKILHSPYAHAIIKSIDTSEAEALDGVLAVVTYKDAPQIRFNANGEDSDVLPSELIFDQKLRYVGDKVAAVAAETPKIAEQALKLIKVEYEELPYYLDPEEALKEGAVKIHENGNMLWEAEDTVGDMQKGFEEADVIIEGRYTVPAIYHAYMEPHTSIVIYDALKKLTVYTPTQDPVGMRRNLARALDMPMSRVRVITPAVGGAFGGKIDLVTEPVGALLAMKCGRPVKITLTRREDIESCGSRHAENLYVRTGIKKTGEITACDLVTYLSAGAQSGATMSAAWAPKGKFFKMYKIPNMHFDAYPAYTNRINGTAMRGFGSPQVFYAMLSSFNEAANRIGMDPADVTYMNMFDPNIIDGLGQEIGNMRGKDCLLRAKELIGYDEAKAEMEKSWQEQGRYLIGVGLAAAPHGCSMYGVMTDSQGAMLKMNEDGTITFFTAASEMGNGSNTMQQMILMEVLGMPSESIAFVTPDTELTLYDVGSYASRGTYVGGGVTLKIANKCKELILDEAEQMMEGVDRSDMELRNNGVYCISDPEKHLTMAEIALHAHDAARDIAISAIHATEAAPISAGVHAVKVRVDTETGEVEVLDYVAVHDVGRAINPLNLESQTHGGIHMGMGYALSEGVVLDEKGAVKGKRLRDSHLFTAAQMPPNDHVKVEFLESYEPSGPFGAKSIAECATVPSGPAVANAVCNALHHHFRDLPLNKEKVLAYLKEKKDRQLQPDY